MGLANKLKPDAYQFDNQKVFIRRDTETGDVILSRKPATWDSFFSAPHSAGVSHDFMDANERYQEQAEREPFDDFDDKPGA